VTSPTRATHLSDLAPRNQLGQLATKTPHETVARLEHKMLKNQGRANRGRIRAQIARGLAAQA
jgi:hypothetical protein